MTLLQNLEQAIGGPGTFDLDVYEAEALRCAAVVERRAREIAACWPGDGIVAESKRYALLAFADELAALRKWAIIALAEELAAMRGGKEQP